MSDINLEKWAGINRQPTKLASGKPVTWYVEEQVEAGLWSEEEIPSEISGLSRPIRVFRAPRKTNLITFEWHGSRDTFCPKLWSDVSIGSGICSMMCRSCFLLLTHRIKRDPMRHLLYDNMTDFEKAVEKWLIDPKRRKQETLGLGIDRSDSLLYEGVMPYTRTLAPLMADANLNRQGNKLVLLTKSANTHFLEEVRAAHRSNLVVTFSLNPEPIADLWEGKWPDTLERVTPPIAKRLEAARFAQDLGFEVRVRVDPILTAPGWEQHYAEFVSQVKEMGINFRYWTLGTYREKNHQLDAWRERWGLPPMEWQPNEGELVRDGTHWHLPEARRIEIYSRVRDLIKGGFPQARVSLCKETHAVRKAVALCNADCNCLL